MRTGELVGPLTYHKLRLEETLNDLRGHQDKVFNAMSIVAHNRGQRDFPRTGGVYESLVQGYIETDQKINRVMGEVYDIKMAEGFSYEVMPEADDEHALGVIEGEVDGKQMRLVGYYSNDGHNLDNWIDGCEGEMDREKLSKEQAQRLWGRFARIVHEREDEKVGGKIALPLP